MGSDDITLPFYERMLDLLRPWCAHLNLRFTSRMNDSYRDINYVLFLLSRTECNIASVHIHRNQHDPAESSCKQALSYARLYEGEVRTDMICRALKMYCELQINQGKYAEATTFAEESYNIAAVAYNPVHPEVQKAVSTLIDCLIRKRELYADRFAQCKLDSLKDPSNGLDQECEGGGTRVLRLSECQNEARKRRPSEC